MEGKISGLESQGRDTPLVKCFPDGPCQMKVSSCATQPVEAVLCEGPGGERRGNVMKARRGSPLCSVTLIVCFVLGLIVSTSMDEAKAHEADLKEASGGLEVCVVVDNNPYKAGLDNPWGFSCVVKGTEKTILFDTGPAGNPLLNNMKTMHIFPQDVDVVVLSHIHQDHTGGLMSFLKENPEVTVYLPCSFPVGFKEAVKNYGAKVVEVGGAEKICDRVYSTGELEGPVNEQSLVIRTDRGSVVISGCAHPGILNILKKARELFKEDLLLAMGGFHLIGMVSEGPGSQNLKSIVSGFKTLRVRYAGPCHCSGIAARRLFKRAYQENYIEIGVGKVIKIDNLQVPLQAIE